MSPTNNAWARLVCWLRGHRWRVVREAPCAPWLMHLHPYAACDADCLRCGAELREAELHMRHASYAERVAIGDAPAVCEVPR